MLVRGPELPCAATLAGAEGLPFSRHRILVPAESWSKVKSMLPHDVSSEALLLAASASALSLWSTNARFVVLVANTPHASGISTESCALISVDESQELSFAERIAALESTVKRTRSATRSTESPLEVKPQVVFALTSAEPAPTTPATAWTTTHTHALPAGVMLLIVAREITDKGLELNLDAAAGLFPVGTIEGMAEALERWLLTLGRDAAAWQWTPTQQAWHTFPAAQMRRRMEMNATHAPIADDRLFSGFLRQLPESFERAAVITPTRTLTYGELYGHACALAHALRQRGIRRNELVAIAASKGWEQIAAAVGITMAGAAYLPVDVELPIERVRLLIERGDARIVITQSERLATLPLPEGVEAIVLADLPVVNGNTPPPQVKISAEDLAYVIFTSGSTGTPKGVMIDHRGAVNTINDMNARFRVQPHDRVLALSRLSFDLSVYDIFGLLAAGGTIVVPAADLTRDPAHWAEMIREHAVTIWDTVPALMQLLVDFLAESPTPVPGSLRHVWMSGDWIPLSLPARIKSLWPDAQITSLGGATEASIWSILYPITAVNPAWRSIPYGRPMVNQTFHVLHPNLVPCPEHVTGELFIGGIGVARGYWKDEKKTNAQFITHPHTGERLYRTGDLGRVSPEGYIEFLGRADFQVKIRGYRIELGEIEAALAAHEAVRAAVAVARGESDQDRHLVAYVVPENAAPIDEASLRGFLHSRLPEYMVPPVIVWLDRLPLTANGKVDLKALPAPDTGTARVAQRAPHAEPTNEIEEILVQIWRAVLAVPRVGIHDDFFALGGNSLSGTRMIIRVREAFAIPLPVERLFEHPTISRLAPVIEQSLLAEIAQEKSAL